ncbi:MAG: prolyl-tRNA synthetase associated domain-containing protein [Hellea sp.]|nr:prolyl-tRNA synthetase associated domain-containing protein [Hellea sp.]
MPASRADLFALFDELEIDHKTTEHQPVFTVEESAEIKASLPGVHTKNLFLKDKGGNFFLICAESHARIKVNKLHPHLGCKRLSFGKAEYLMEHLGVEPGSVTLFSVMNDKPGAVKLIVDKTLADADIVNFHPLKNDATTAISADDMIKFAKATGHEPLIMDFAILTPDE